MKTFCDKNGSYSEHGLYCRSSAWKYHTQESKCTPFRRAENPDKQIESFIKDKMKGVGNTINIGKITKCWMVFTEQLKATLELYDN